MNQTKGFINVILVIIILILLGIVSYLVFSNKTALAPEMPALTTSTEPNLNQIFGLSQKEAGTKIYYSEKLGIGFTYLPVANQELKITEIGNKISLGDQSIEVFAKDPSLTLDEAIKSQFLQGYDSKDCFVKSNEASEQKLLNYISAVISFPPATDPNGPWWQNSDKCPQNYSETNAVQYFLMNKDVPGKFMFVKIGQDAVASDGTPLTPTGSFGWSHSIRILDDTKHID